MHLLKFFTISQGYGTKESPPMRDIDIRWRNSRSNWSTSLKARCSIPGRLLRGDVQEELEVDLVRWTEGRGTGWGRGHFRLGKSQAKCQSQGIKEHNLATVNPDWSEGEVGGLYGERWERLTCAELPWITVQRGIFIYYKIIYTYCKKFKSYQSITNRN